MINCVIKAPILNSVTSNTFRIGGVTHGTIATCGAANPVCTNGNATNVNTGPINKNGIK